MGSSEAWMSFDSAMYAQATPMASVGYSPET